MPRPSNGYINQAGQPVPATNQITSRYMDPGALFYWNWDNGRKGLPFKTTAAINIGSAVHKMIELYLMGAAEREIEATLHEYLSAHNHLEMANAAFRAFRDWKDQVRLRIIAQETSIVSEKYQYGGTPDLIAIVDNMIGIVDFKTSAKGVVYDNMKVAQAAHANLWNEANPKMTIDTYHIITLPKDGGAFKHHAFSDLTREWETFKLYRELWRLEKEWDIKPKKAAPKPYTIPVFPKADKPLGHFDTVGQYVTEPAPATSVKPRIRVKMQTTPTLTMAEMLRAYGHVPGAAA